MKKTRKEAVRTGRTDKATVINNISQLNLEIDYDRLAKAIIKAQRTSEERASKSLKEAKLSLFQSILQILKGKKSSDGRFLVAPFAVIVSVVYRMIFIVGLIALILLAVAMVQSLASASWQGWAIVGNIIVIILGIAILFTLFLYLIVFWGAANDVEQEKDKNYVINVFTGLVSLAALIVAIVALNR